MPKKPIKKPVKKPVKKAANSSTHNVNNTNHIHIHTDGKKQNNRRRQKRRTGGGAITNFQSTVHPPNIIVPQYNRPQFADFSSAAEREKIHTLGNYMNPNIVGHPPVTNPINFTSQVPVSNTNQMADQTPVNTGIPSTPLKGTVASKPKGDSFDYIYEESSLNPMHRSNRNRQAHSSPSPRERVSPNQPDNLTDNTLPRPRTPRDQIPAATRPFIGAMTHLTGALQPKRGRGRIPNAEKTAEEIAATRSKTQATLQRKKSGGGGH